MDVEKQKNVFKSLAKAQSLSLLHCFVNFLEFCREGVRGKPFLLSTYHYEQSEVIEAIADIKSYLEEKTKELEARGRSFINQFRQI